MLITKCYNFIDKCTQNYLIICLFVGFNHWGKFTFLNRKNPVLNLNLTLLSFISKLQNNFFHDQNMKSTFSVKQINLTGEGVPYL